MLNLHCYSRRAALLLFPLLSPLAAMAQGTPTAALPDMVVTGAREAEPRAETPSAISRISPETIREVRPAHPSELLNRLPGVTVQQTNGEGSIVGIRNPIGTSPLYLYLQDNVPVQAAGFFNHNALYLMNIPQAGSIEVIRGPGTALQGNDAIGGVINVLTPAPTAGPYAEAAVEYGSYNWVRATGSASHTIGAFGLRGDVNLTHTDGWRNRTGYDRQSINLRSDIELAGDSILRTTLSLNNINQQTGANSYVSGRDYINNPRQNNTPFAYRRVEALFASMAWERRFENGLLTITPFIRANRMDLLPSFQLNNDPVRYVQQYQSIGALVRYRHDLDFWRTRIITGVDLDLSPGSYVEDRLNVSRTTSVPPLNFAYATGRRLYDFDVTYKQVSPYVQVQTSPIDRLRLVAGLRFDAIGFDYHNNLASGAFASGLTGRSSIFFRPGDTSRSYQHLSPSLGGTFQFAPDLAGFLAYKQSFRTPEASQLFRQGSNLNTVNLRPITANTIEGGFRSIYPGNFTWEAVAYHTTKHNDILGFTANNTLPTQTNNGVTRHIGVEAAAAVAISAEVRLSGALGYANHTYVRWVNSASQDLSGKTMAAAPQVTANAVLSYAPSWLRGALGSVEWQKVGSYWLSDANTAQYNGHNLVNLRAEVEMLPGFKVFGRVMNALNTRWATNASLNGTTPQYAPGMPLNLYGGVAVTF